MNEMDPDLTGEANKRLQLKAVIWWKLFIVSLNFKHVLFAVILKYNFGCTHAHVESNFQMCVLLFCTIKTQLNIHFTKVWYLKCRSCVGGSCCGLVRRQLSSTLTTTQPGFFLPLYKPPEPKMTQSEPQRQSEPRRLLHAVYNWHKYTEPL